MPNAFSSLLNRLGWTSSDDLTSQAPTLPSTVHAPRALELVAEGATLVDVREAGEWRSGHAALAIHITLSQLARQTRRLPQDRPVVVMCQSGSRSKVAAKQLRNAGFRATSLSGGIGTWQAAGGSVRSGR